MPIAFTSYGAAKTVTGSRHLVDTGAARILIDCGIHQERQLRERDFEGPDFDLASVDAVILTHAHLDHVGLLPRWARLGLRCPVYGSRATCDIVPVLWHDAARIMAEDVAYKRKRHRKEGRSPRREVEPLYDENDVVAALTRLVPVDRDVAFPVADGVRATLRAAGHILGSSTVTLEVAGETPFTLCISGDLGRADRPILPDPVPPPAADVIVMESTYGDREHPPTEDVGAALADAVNRTVERGGVVMIPSFAVERAQELLWWFSHLRARGRMAEVPVFLDSPMAVALLEVFRERTDSWDDEMTAEAARGFDALDFPGLTLTPTAEASKAINEVDRPHVVIAGSGMCTGGRIKHHLKRHIGDPRNLLLFVGYQAGGTLGRIILDGAEHVRIHGRDHAVGCEVAQLRGFSGHADRGELLAWLQSAARPPEQVLVVHGGENVTRSFAEFIRERTGLSARVPGFGERIILRG